MSKDEKKLLKIALSTMFTAIYPSNTRSYTGSIGRKQVQVAASSPEEASYLVTKIARASNERFMGVNR